MTRNGFVLKGVLECWSIGVMEKTLPCYKDRYNDLHTQ